MKYNKKEDIYMTLKIRKFLKELPDFCREYFLAINETTLPRTRLAYCYDLRLFFNYLITEQNKFEHIKDIKDMTISDLENINAVTLREFMEYLSFYYPVQDIECENEHINAEKGKARKLASVRGILKYFYKAEKISSNPGQLVETPKIRSKEIVRLEVDEIAKLLDEVESGEKLTKSQKNFHRYTQKRDLALITLLVGTGIRVSECVGIDIDDISFEINGVKIIRKGGNESIIYFGDEVEAALKDYLVQRMEMKPVKGDEKALFLSLQNKRIGVRTVQNLVKKYAQNVIPLKNISPHKLRSTYGTQLYSETGDIYLVASVLGHKDVNTTKEHYANMDENKRRSAANIVKLRE